MEIRKHIFFALAAVVLMVLEMHGLGFAATAISGSGAAGTDAASAGGNLVTVFESTIGGKIGLFIGLVLTLWGLWTWIVKQDTAAGLTMIAGGVAITLLPNIFNGMRGVVDGVVTQFGGNR